MGKLQLAYDDLDTQDVSQNPNYMAVIHCESRGIHVELPMPENFNFSLGSSFASPFAQGFVRNGIATATTLLGLTNLVTQSMTMQVWQGTTDVQFQMTFELFATTDADKEVVKPIYDLLSLTLPGRTSSFGGFLVPPGPSIDTKNSDVNVSFKSGVQANVVFKNEISLQIGNFVRFDSVVIESVNHVFDSHFDSRGLPLAANIDISFKTFVVPTVEDLSKILIGSSKSSTPATSGTGSTVSDVRKFENSQG